MATDVLHKTEDVQFYDGDVEWVDHYDSVILAVLSAVHDNISNVFTEAWQAFDDSGGSVFDDSGGSVFEDFGGLWLIIDVGALSVQSSAADLLSSDVPRFPVGATHFVNDSLNEHLAKGSAVSFHLYALADHVFNRLLTEPSNAMVVKIANAFDSHCELNCDNIDIVEFDVGLSVDNALSDLISTNIFVEIEDAILLILDNTVNLHLISDSDVIIDRMLSVDSLVNSILAIHDSFVLKNRTVSVDDAINEVLNKPLNQELVTNGSMEADSDWNDYGTPPTNERSSTRAYKGTYSRHVVTTDDGVTGDGIQQVVSGEVGKTYRVVVHVYRSSGIDAIRVYWDGAVLGTIAVSNSWQEVSVSRTKQNAANDLIFYVPNANTEFYVDDVSISEIADSFDLFLNQMMSVDNSINDNIGSLIDLLLFKTISTDNVVCDLLAEVELALAFVKYVSLDNCVHSLFAHDLSLSWLILFDVDKTVHSNNSADIENVYELLLSVDSSLNDLLAKNLNIILHSVLDVLDTVHDAATDRALLYITGIVEIVLKSAVNDLYSENINTPLATSVDIDKTEHDLFSEDISLLLFKTLSIDSMVNDNISSLIDLLLFKTLSIDSVVCDLLTEGTLAFENKVLSLISAAHDNLSSDIETLIGIVHSVLSTVSNTYGEDKFLFLDQLMAVDNSVVDLLARHVAKIDRNRFISKIYNVIHDLFAENTNLRYDAKPVILDAVNDLLSSFDSLEVIGFPVIYLDSTSHSLNSGKDNLSFDITIQNILSLYNKNLVDLIRQKSHRLANANNAVNDLVSDDVAWLKALWLVVRDSTLDHISDYAKIWDTGVFALYNYLAKDYDYVFIAKDFEDKAFK